MRILGYQKKHEVFHETTLVQKKIISEKNFTYRIILKVINKFLLKGKKNKILDIGCGAGTLSLYLASKKNEVLGIDIAENAIYSCKSSAEYLNLKNVSFQQMPFPDKIPNGKFDLIICSEVLEHLKDDKLALKKIFSLLNNGGIAIISTPSIDAPIYRLGLARKFDERVGHLRRYSLEKLVSMCKESGFIIIETRKTEGVLRNFLFLNPIAGKLVRFIRWNISNVVSFFDDISLTFFGESQIFVVVKK